VLGNEVLMRDFIEGRMASIAYRGRKVPINEKRSRRLRMESCK